MSLDDKFVLVRTAFYEIISNFFKKIAGLFGYPENPGMPISMDLPGDDYARSKFLDSLPVRHTFWPPLQKPETWFETIFGPLPKTDTIERFIYETKEEGFYNFYIENYQNIYFLPDWVSEFIQVKLHICLDISVLETFREVLFVTLMVYYQIILLRVALSWYIYINPYTLPWSYLIALVDWTEELFHGLIPSILGVNLTGGVVLGIVGEIGDSLNHLVFTMPFLPSEGVETKLFINGEIRDVLVFHYLPILWYRYRIPNEIREFWYKERPDILNYMQKAYQNLEIQFLPDKKDLFVPDKIARDLLFPDKIVKDLSLISDSLLPQNSDNLIQTDIFLTSIAMINEDFHNFVLMHIDKYI